MTDPQIRILQLMADQCGGEAEPAAWAEVHPVAPKTRRAQAVIAGLAEGAKRLGGAMNVALVIVSPSRC